MSKARTARVGRPLGLLLVVVAGAIGCSSDPGTAPLGNTAGAPTNQGGSTGVAGSVGTSGGGSLSTAGSSTAGSAGAPGGSNSGGSDAGGMAGGGAAGASGKGGMGGMGGGAGSGGSGGGGAKDCSTLKLCDGFEGDAPGKGTSPWTASGAVEVVTDVFHTGTHSVHMKAASGGAVNINISEKKTFPSTDSWGRAWVQIKATSTEHQMYIGINMSGDQARLLNRLGSDTPQVNFQKGDVFYAAEVKFTQGMWFCYEWHVTDSATSIYIDGKKQALKNGTNGDAPGAKGGTALLLGFQRFVNGSAGADVWYDDVAVGDAQIGCQ